MVKVSVQDNDIKKVSRPKQQNLAATEEELLRNRVFLVEQAVKNRVQYNELMQFRLKSDKIELGDLSQDIINQFLNEESIKRLEDLINSKISIEELENYVTKQEFELYKKWVTSGFKELRDTAHEHHDEALEKFGYLLGLLENKIDDQDFALLEHRVSNLELNGGGGSGGGSVDLSQVNSRLSALETADTQIRGELSNKVNLTELSGYRRNDVVIFESDLAPEVQNKLNSISNAPDLSEVLSKEEFQQYRASLATEDGAAQVGFTYKEEITANMHQKARYAGITNVEQGLQTALKELTTVQTSLNNVYTKEEVNNKVSQFITADYVDTAVSNIEVNWSDITDTPVIPERTSDLELDNVYSTEQIDAKLAELSTGGQVDLSSYATKELLTQEINKLETSKASKTELSAELLKKANAVHTHSEYAVKTEVTEKLSQLETSLEEKANTDHVHDNYATKVEVSLKADSATLVSEIARVEALINNSGESQQPEVDLSGKADLTYVNQELDKKANVVHTHKEYATTNALDALTNTVAALTEEVEGIQVPDTSIIEADIQTLKTSKADTATLNNELAKKANTVHTHNEYAEKTTVTELQQALQQAKELITTLQDTVTKLTERVVILEGFHDIAVDSNIEWEVTFTKPSGLPMSFHLYGLEEMRDRTVTIEDAYGDDYSGQLTRFKLFNMGTPLVPREEPVPIYVTAANGPSDKELENFDWDPETGELSFGAFMVKDIVVKAVKYKEAV